MDDVGNRPDDAHLCTKDLLPVLPRGHTYIAVAPTVLGTVFCQDFDVVRVLVVYAALKVCEHNRGQFGFSFTSDDYGAQKEQAGKNTHRTRKDEPGGKITHVGSIQTKDELRRGQRKTLALQCCVLRRTVYDVRRESCSRLGYEFLDAHPRISEVDAYARWNGLYADLRTAPRASSFQWHSPHNRR